MVDLASKASRLSVASHGGWVSSCWTEVYWKRRNKTEYCRQVSEWPWDIFRGDIRFFGQNACAFWLHFPPTWARLPIRTLASEYALAAMLRTRLRWVFMTLMGLQNILLRMSTFRLLRILGPTISISACLGKRTMRLIPVALPHQYWKGCGTSLTRKFGGVFGIFSLCTAIMPKGAISDNLAVYGPIWMR